MTARTSALDTVVFGVDIQSGDVRGDAPSYAVVAFDGESIDRNVVSHHKLRRLIDREEPAMVATDNMYELAPDKDALVHFLRELPDETRLVQVTGAEQPEPLSRVASRHGVPYGKDPMEEAEAAARLAAMNVGQEVSAFTNTTRVKVSRGRSTGKGGWSEDRYTRRIHGSVKKRSREVGDELDAANLDYDREVTEKYGGFSNAVFTVEGRPEEIPVSTERSGDVRIEVERERRDGIEFQPLVKRRNHVVVGIDPGTTTAAAVVDLDGTVLDTMSTRTGDTATVTEWLIERGRPIIVAADVTPMPETVEGFRRSFEAAGWAPETDLPVDEKKHRAREVSYDDDHQRDAVAAALFAYDAHADQFDRIARKVPPQHDLGAVVARVVADEQSVESVLREFESDDDGTEETTDHTPRELTEDEKQIKRLKARVDRLESHTEDLKETIARKDDQIEEYEQELSTQRQKERREARERQEITRLERENERLERELEAERETVAELEETLERLKALWKLDHSNFADVSEKQQDLVPVKVVEKFTTGAIDRADETYGLAENDVIYLKDASGGGRSTARQLADVNPKVVLKEGSFAEMADELLFEAEVPVSPAADVTIQEVDELAVAREHEIEAAIEDWEERASQRKKEQNEQMVERLISEHRASDRGAESGG